MGKAVLISIQPKWCGLIAAGKKTLEIRKSRPKQETPFKVYIYCTLSGSNEFFKDALNGDVAAWNRGKWCDRLWLAHLRAENLRETEASF